MVDPIMPEDEDEINSIEIPNINLRLAEASDCEFLWKLRNERVTRMSSFNHGYLPYDQHKDWFFKKLNDDNTKILIILDRRKTRVGQVRFDMYDEANEKKAEVHLTVDVNERNKGYGKSALKISCDFIISKFIIAEVKAHIKPENENSINTFLRAGFRNDGLKLYKGNKTIEMVLNNC